MKYMSPRDLAWCSIFGAAAWFLPVFFHMFSLGSTFLPMYLPLMALAFFVRPVAAAITAFCVPLLSAAVTGMPPFFPPVAFFMAIELAFMAFTASFLSRRMNKVNSLWILIPVLFTGRILHVIMVYVVSLWINLPAKYTAGITFISGWPGVVLMIAVIPVLIKIRKTLPERIPDESRL